jgi:hypothetical protein
MLFARFCTLLPVHHPHSCRHAPHGCRVLSKLESIVRRLFRSPPRTPYTQSPRSMASHTPSLPTSPSPPSPSSLVLEVDVTVTNMDTDMNKVTNASETLESIHKQNQNAARLHTAAPAFPGNSKLPRPTTLTPFASARASYSTGAASPFWSKMRRTRSSLAVDRLRVLVSRSH